MKIYTLGTGHGDSTFCRFNSSTLYEADDGSLYLIDAGAPVEALIRRKALDISRLKTIFITHMHDDHAGGLPGLIKQLTKYAARREGCPLELYLPEETAIKPLINWVLALHEPADSEVIVYKAVSDGVIYEDDNIIITAHRTEHLRTRGRNEGDPCSFAYELELKREGKRIMHTGDLTHDLRDFPEVLYKKHFDLCLMEATHYPPTLGAQKLKDADIDRLIFIHLYDKWHNTVADAWQFHNGEKELLSHYSDCPFHSSVAHDGDEFFLL